MQDGVVVPAGVLVQMNQHECPGEFSKFSGDSLLIQVAIELEFIGTGRHEGFGLLNGCLERFGQMGLTVSVNCDVRFRMVQCVLQQFAAGLVIVACDEAEHVLCHDLVSFQWHPSL